MQIAGADETVRRGALAEDFRDTLLAAEHSPACLSCQRDKSNLFSLFCSFSFPVSLRLVKATASPVCCSAPQRGQLREQQTWCFHRARVQGL